MQTTLQMTGQAFVQTTLQMTGPVVVQTTLLMTGLVVGQTILRINRLKVARTALRMILPVKVSSSGARSLHPMPVKVHKCFAASMISLLRRASLHGEHPQFNGAAQHFV